MLSLRNTVKNGINKSALCAIKFRSVRCVWISSQFFVLRGWCNLETWHLTYLSVVVQPISHNLMKYLLDSTLHSRCDFWFSNRTRRWASVIVFGWGDNATRTFHFALAKLNLVQNVNRWRMKKVDVGCLVSVAGKNVYWTILSLDRSRSICILDPKYNKWVFEKEQTFYRVMQTVIRFASKQFDFLLVFNSEVFVTPILGVSLVYDTPDSEFTFRVQINISESASMFRSPRNCASWFAPVHFCCSLSGSISKTSLDERICIAREKQNSIMQMGQFFVFVFFHLHLQCLNGELPQFLILLNTFCVNQKERSTIRCIRHTAL